MVTYFVVLILSQTENQIDNFKKNEKKIYKVKFDIK